MVFNKYFTFRNIRSEPEVSGNKPGLRNNHATATMDKYMYLHGGHNGDIWLDDLYILDMNSFIWNRITVTGSEVFKTLKSL